MIRVAIAGAGKAGSSLLEIFSKSREIDLVGIVDIDSNAPGLNLAKKKGIYTADNIMALGDRAPQVIINATGKNDIAGFVGNRFSSPVEVMGGDGAYVLWEIVNEYVKMQTELCKLNEGLEEKVKNRTRELELSNMELSKSSNMKSRFIANASHELRTPLNSIIGFSEILKDQLFGPLNEKQERYADNIYTSGKHLLHLVNSILDLAKIESGKTEVVYEKFDLKETVNDITDVLGSLSETKSIRLTNNIPPDIFISADKFKFKQIFYNLISNAVKFTQKNGEVGIRAEIPDDNIQMPHAPRNHKFIKLTVWDSGIGIKPEDREKVFEEFQQIDESKSTKGTGLGLSLTKKLVEMHAGYIDVEESAEKGAAFNVYLPLISFESERRRKQRKFGGHSFRKTELDEGPLVLVAEDDPETSEILTIHLMQAGYRVAHAYTGEEVMEKAKKEKPFVIVLDIMLPKKDGWTVLKSLKEDSETFDIPVIIHSMRENRELAFALGATDYIVKPASKEVLIKKIKSVPVRSDQIRRQLSILAVTDDPFIKKSLQSLLLDERERYRLNYCNGSRDCFDMVVIAKPDLIIVDSEIAGGGFDLISRFKKNEALKDVPIFAFTGKGDTRGERHAALSQIEAVLIKDAVNSNKLLHHLNNLQIIYPGKAGLIDKTTGLFNEKYYSIRLSQEVSRAKRDKAPFVLVLISIDHFVHYEKIKGEYYANLVMKKTADAIKKNLRTSDVVIRYSYGTFAVILAGTSKEPALGVTKRFVSLINDHSYLEEDVQPMGKITASMGIGEYRCQTTEEMDSIVHEAVLKAMNKGGNRIECAQDKKNPPSN